MKLQVHAYGVQVVAQARDADEALRGFKTAIISGAPKWTRPMMGQMDALTIAREAVKRDNAAQGCAEPLPSSAQEFLDWALRRGYISLLEE